MKFIQYFLFSAIFFTLGILLSDHGFVSFEGGKPSVVLDRELPENKKNLKFSLFWEVWDKVHQDYFAKEKIDSGKLIYGAIKGMVAAVGDPYTEFLPPEQQKKLKEDLRGSFEGVGIHIGFKGSRLAVVAPVSGTPADRAGIQAGDFILGIKDEEREIDKGTTGMTLEEAVDAIRGPSNTQVILTLLREGVDKAFEVTLTRAKIDVPSVEVKFTNGSSSDKKIAHLKLLTFVGETSSEWQKAIAEITKECSGSCSGVILDLRNNHGGFLSGSVFIASEFLREGVVVIQEDATGKKSDFSVDRRGKLLDVPLVVLVNKGSASAAEIVAGALRDHGRAKLIGETTFGKGTIQESRELTGGAGLKITSARWLTPKEAWVNDKGLEPDIKVEDKEDTQEDEQLQEAIKILNPKSE